MKLMRMIRFYYTATFTLGECNILLPSGNNIKHLKCFMQWIGMGNQELLDYFSGYEATKARHSYGPQGHRGMSVLIFEASAVGYLEAERLSKHFEDHGRDKNAWQCNRIAFCPGGKRQLYGYMAEKRDLDYFNLHSQGRLTLS